MTRRSVATINQAVRYALMTGAVAVGYAATASAGNANTSAHLGKVTVTGTRIKRTDVETAQPITRISRQQIEKSGYTNIGQLLGRLSSTGSHGNSSTRLNDGRTTVNLRSLGANRNLVLVNGKRWMRNLSGSTNLNTIPTSIIDHIEILQDGASAIYGSDAIAGVINIITIKSFKGAEAHAYYGIHNDHKTGYWDGQIKQYDFTIGSGNNRGNIVFNATYREQNTIKKSERELPRTAIPGVTPAYIDADTGTPLGDTQLFGPAVSGRTFGQGTCGIYNPKRPAKTLCDLTLQNNTAQASLQNFRNFKPTDHYDVKPLADLQSPAKDVSLYMQGHYDLFDNVTFTANAAYIRDETTLTRYRSVVYFGATTKITGNGKKVGLAASNPYNPFGVDLVPNTTAPCLAAGSCIGVNLLKRRPSALPLEIANHNRDYFHIFVGFSGYVNLFNREIDWDVGFAQNRVQDTYIPGGQINTGHLAMALGPASQCTSPCVPVNVFGKLTQDQVNYITFEKHHISQDNVRDWTANLSSDLYNLPAGPLGLAIGYERIDNYGYSHPDSIVVDNNANGAIGSLENGRVVRNAEYTELNIPLLADVPGAKRLSVDVANRWSQFKRAGGIQGQTNAETFVHNSSGRLNIRWQVINDLLLRASWAQGFRSPNVPDLFSGQNRSYTIFQDPCAGGQYGSYRGGPLPPNCPNGTPDSQNAPGLNFTTGSNPNLEPEKSISRTVGFVYSPKQVPGLDVNADYFKIEINNAISTIGAQNIIDGCFNTASFCNLVTSAANQVLDVRNIDTNVGGLLTEGIDVGLHYKFPSTSVGDFDARIDGTFLKVFDRTNVNRATKTGFATSHLAGATNHPKRRFNGYLDWDYGNWSAQYHIEYLDATMERCSIPIEGHCSLPNRTADYQGAPDQFPLGRTRLGATVYHDVHVDYTVPSINTTFALGVNNLFDKKPPIPGGKYFNFGFYRLPSRLVYGSVRVRF